MDIDIDKIIENLNFKYVKPNNDASQNLNYNVNKYLFYLYSLIRNRQLRHFTFYNNTEHLINKQQFESFKKKLFNIEGMSTIANAWIINQIASSLKKDQNYLNIGCWKGFSLIAGMIDTKCNVYGVDNFAWKEHGKIEFYKNFNTYKSSNKHFFFEGDYLQFLHEWAKKDKYIDFYFYDGPHTYNDQYQSLEIASTYFRSGSIILVDDTNWDEPREATMNFISKNNEKYKILSDLKCNHAKHPTYWNGLIIFQKT